MDNKCTLYIENWFVPNNVLYQSILYALLFHLNSQQRLYDRSYFPSSYATCASLLHSIHLPIRSTLASLKPIHYADSPYLEALSVPVSCQSYVFRAYAASTIMPIYTASCTLCIRNNASSSLLANTYTSQVCCFPPS